MSDPHAFTSGQTVAASCPLNKRARRECLAREGALALTRFATIAALCASHAEHQAAQALVRVDFDQAADVEREQLVGQRARGAAAAEDVKTRVQESCRVGAARRRRDAARRELGPLQPRYCLKY